MEITAPAKINLYLKVLSKRKDGYHDIVTLFERISLFDRVSIETAGSSTRIHCDNPAVPTGEDSLMGKAASLFRKEAGNDLNFNVKLNKNIPVGAGLGGGSSDVAALLKGMNELAGNPLGKDALFRIAGRLGADVPFFLADSSFAYGKGRGDIIQEVVSSLKLCHILVSPPFEVSTKEAYEGLSAFGLTKDKGVDTMFTAFLDKGNISGLSENLCNDLQAVALRNFPILEKVFSELKKEGAKGVLLSGSGPTVFGIFDCKEVEKAAESIKGAFPGNWKVFVVRTY
ncbi:MAG: 4-(cytidine 5'-diphospho)-2-C-methyl-D-erythritol kinase [Candidatus Omnitrophota bacterium]|jgi:4-diphosphocytidyl-2-C-methyl-D-erythritol kinase